MQPGEITAWLRTWATQQANTASAGDTLATLDYHGYARVERILRTPPPASQAGMLPPTQLPPA
jgi:hypothetical protein